MKSITHISLAGITMLVAIACSKGGADARASSAPPANSAHGDFASRGGDACARYLTPDVVAGIATAPAGTITKLTSQGCNYVKDQVTISILLINAPPGAYTAYVARLSKTQPLAGVGDQAVETSPLSKAYPVVEVMSQKGSNMGCDMKIEADQPSLKLEGPALGQALGAICNTIYADAR